MDVKARLGHNLRRIRQQQGLSQEQFALEHDVDRTYISGIERGVRNPTIIRSAAQLQDLEEFPLQSCLVFALDQIIEPISPIYKLGEHVDGGH